MDMTGQQKPLAGNVITQEQNECTTFGQSLINFMSLATGSVKTALQKPENYKKNINHRRYLQKQLKICTRKHKRGVKSKSVAKKVQRIAAEGYREKRSARDVITSQQRPDFMSYPPVLGYGDTNDVHTNKSYYVGPCTAHYDYTGMTAVNESAARQEDILPEVVEETGYFMSGEELTRTLDIKDLFVPERFESHMNNTPLYHPYENITPHATFQTIPSTSNILSW